MKLFLFKHFLARNFDLNFELKIKRKYKQRRNIVYSFFFFHNKTFFHKTNKLFFEIIFARNFNAN